MKPLNILLAADAESIGLSVSSYLRDAGHSITDVKSGEEAIAAFRDGEFDLVLMDAVMPGIGGFEAAKQIKALATRRWVPIIITGAGSEEDLLNGLLAGADDFMVKPLNPMALDLRIRSTMRIVGIQGAAATVIDSVIEGIIQIDQGGRIRRFNKSAERIFGYAESEVLNQNVKILMPSPYTENHDDYLATYVATRQAKVIGHPRLVTGLRKNGEQFPMQLGVAEANTPDGKYFVGTVRDLTVEERLRIELAQKTEELEQFFSISLDLYCIASLDGRLLKINQAWEKVLGYPLAELKNRNILDLVHPDDQKETQAAMACLVNGLPVSAFTNRYVTCNGDYRFIEWHAVPYKTHLVYAAARDVTVSRQREQALAKSERFLKLLVDVIPGMVGYWDSELRCRFANRHYLEWFGKTPEVMQGIQLQDLLGPELLEKNEPFIRAALRGEVQHFERTLSKADGSIGYTWAHYIPDLVDGMVKGFFVLIADITELKAAELALRENRRFLSDLIEHSGTVIFAKDNDGRYTLVNRQYEEFTGLNRTAILGLTDAELYPATIAQVFRQHDLAVMASGKPDELEETLENARGIHSFLTSKFPLRNEEGKINGVCGIATDITERKKIQNEIERLSQIDLLTNLANRRHFMALAEREFARAVRYKGELSVLMIDADHFKNVNDSYGHKAGDAVLATLGEILRTSLRDVDIAGRIGGEEFAVVLPETGTDEAFDVAERIRTCIAASSIPVQDGTPLKVTVSIGISKFTDEGSSIEILMDRADEQLYLAKRSGRNKVCVRLD
ncbi:PAS domain S-box protein [Azonexus sp. IMCC34842]|uniref:PAS domain S-box protein n=1 Tax=Azonexus sp. IMCC34842 TaxID=3420950 RepID=UPI003D0C67BF